MTEITPPDPIGREIRLFSTAYGLLGYGCVHVALFVDPVKAFPDYVRPLLISAGVLLLVTATGGILRRGWVMPVAITVHGLMALAALVAVLNRAKSTAPSSEFDLPWVFYVPIAALYFFFLRFWLSDSVRSWFASSRTPRRPRMTDQSPDS